MQKRFLAVLLSVCMIISLLPTQAFAVGVEDVNEGIMLLAEGDGSDLDIGGENNRSLYVHGNPTRGGTLTYTGLPEGWESGKPVPAGSTVTFTVEPATGYQVDEVILETTATKTRLEAVNGEYSFTMTNSLTVVNVNFVQTPYTITSNVTGEGTVTAAVGSETVTSAHYQDVVTITATPTTGTDYKVFDVAVTYGEGTDKTNVPVTPVEGTPGKYTFTMPANAVTVVATFKQPHDVTVNLDENAGGTVTANPESAMEGETVTLTVTPKEGYGLKEGSLKVTNGTEDVPLNAGTYTFTMPNAPVTVTATFLGEPFGATIRATTNGAPTLTVTTGDDDSVVENTGDGPDFWVRAGADVTIEGHPDTGYLIKTVAVQDTTHQTPIPVEANISDDGKTATFTMPPAAVNVIVTYAKPVLTVNLQDAAASESPQTEVAVATTEGGNDTPVDPDQSTTNKYTIDAGSKVKLTIAVPSGYVLSSLGEGIALPEGTPGTNVTNYVYEFTMGPDTIVEVTTAKLYSVTITEVGDDGQSNNKAELDLSVPQTNGKIAAGTLVTINTTAADGYEVKSVVATKITGNATVEVTEGENGAYTFTMPTDDVAVAVTFDKKPLQATVKYTDGTSDLTFTTTTAPVTVAPTNSGDTVAVNTGMTATCAANAQADNGNWYIFTGLTAVDVEGSTVNLTNNNDGTYTFTMGSKDVELTATYEKAVASVNDGTNTIYCVTFADVISEAAKVTGTDATATVTLLEDCLDIPVWSIDNTVVLNLNGHKLSKTHGDYTIKVTGELTINGPTGSIENGFVPTQDQSSSSTICSNAGGKITINGGIIGNSVGTSSAAVKVNGKDGVLIINDGTIGTSEGTGPNYRSIQTYGNVTINNGDIKGGVQVWANTGDNVSAGAGNLEIKGGTFGGSVILCGTTSETTQNAGSMTITGGTFAATHKEGETDAENFVGVWGSTGVTLDTITSTANIKGGEFNCPVGISLKEDATTDRDYAVANPTTGDPLVIIGKGEDSEGNETSPVFAERPGDSYLDTEFAASLTPGADGKYTVEEGFAVSVTGYDPADTTKHYTVEFAAGTAPNVVTGDGLLKVPTGTSVTMTITTDPGYEITVVKIDGVTQTLATDGEYTITVSKAIAVDVSCKATDYDITIDENMTDGKVAAQMSGETVTTANAGQTVTLVVTPDVGKQLKKDTLTVMNGSTKVDVTPDAKEANTFTFTMPAGNVTVSAEFEDASYTVDLVEEPETHGTVKVYLRKAGETADVEQPKLDELDPIHKGDTLSVTVNNVAPGYEVASVNIKATAYTKVFDQIVPVDVDRDLTFNEATGKYSITMDNDIMKSTTVDGSDIIITVTYQKIKYNVVSTVATNGDENNDGGTVTVAVADAEGTSATDTTKATIGDTVTFTVTPKTENGYIVKEATLKIGTGAATPVTLTPVYDQTETTKVVGYTYTVKLGTNADSKEVLDNIAFHVDFVKQGDITVTFTKTGATKEPSATISVNNGTAASLTNGQAWGTKVNAGDQVKITVTPDTGDGIKKVTSTSTPSVTDLDWAENADKTWSITFTMPAGDISLSVAYMTPLNLTLGNTPTNGSVTKVQYTPDKDTEVFDASVSGSVYTVEENSIVKIVFTADAGYELDTLTYGGTEANKNNISSITNADGTTTYTFTDPDQYTAAKTFSVTFKASMRNGTLSIGTNGSLRLDGTDVTVNSERTSFSAPTGTEVTVTVTPDFGYDIATFTVNGADKKGDLTTDNKYTFTMPATGTVAIAVTFTAHEYKITVDETANGTVEVTGADTDKDGNQVAITDKPLTIKVDPASAEYEVDKVEISYWYWIKIQGSADKKVWLTETLKAESDGKTYKFNMPGSDVTVTATFKKIEVPDTSVAAIGSTGYPTVDAAFADVKDGQTIVLMKTATANDQLTVSGKNITLDLNGNTLTKTHNGYTVSVDNGGDLTITDSKSGGKIANGYESGPSTTLQANNGKLIIESGIIENGLPGESSAIKVEKQGTLEINGGTIGACSDSGVDHRSIQSFGEVTINDGTIQGVIQVWTAVGENVKPGKLTINNGTFQDSVVVCNASGYPLTGEVTINDGTFSGPAKTDAYTPMVGIRIPPVGYEVAGEVPKMTINGGTFNVETGIWRAGANGGFLTEDEAKTRSYLTIEDGSFSTEPKASDVAADKVAVKGTDGRWAIETAVAKIGNVNYATVAAAITAAKNDDSIVLLTDVTAPDQLTVTNKTITLDLNGHTLTKTHTGYTVSVGKDGDLTIVDSEGNGAIANGAPDTSTTLQANNDGKLTIKGGTIKNGLKPECSAIKVEELGELIIDGGLIKAAATGGVNTRSIQTFGNTTINGGTIEGAVQVWTWRDSATDDVGHYPSKLTINNGTFQNGVVICSAVTSDVSRSRYVFGGTVIINGGTFNGDKADGNIAMVAVRIPSWTEAQLAGQSTKVEMTINGGKFDVPVGVYDLGVEGTNKWVTDSANYLTIKGGSFKNELSYDNYIADGMEVKLGDDGRYTIVEKEPEQTVYEAKIGDDTYETVEDAFAAAVNGDTIVLLTDANTESNKLIMSDATKSITLNLNGHTLTKTHGGYTIAVNAGTLTVIDTVGGGKIANGYTSGPSSTIRANNGGTVIIGEANKANDFTIANGLTQKNCSALKVDEEGTLVIYGGTIGKSVSDGINDRSIQTYGQTTIHGGTITGVVQVWTWRDTGNEVDQYDPSTLTIDGGEFQNGVIICSVPTADANNVFGGTVTITGGTFNNKGVSDEWAPVVAVRIPSWEDNDFSTHSTTVEMNISGGTFDVPVRVEKGGVQVTTGVDYLNITGGSFNAEPAANDVADDMIAVQGGDQRWTIVKAPEQPDVAQIGEETYKTIEAAFAAAVNGDTIVLLTDADTGDNKLILNDAAKSITLDLHGNSLTKTHSGYTIAVNAGTLAIKDTVGGGKIANGYTSGPSSTLRANNGGTVIIGSANKAENNFTIANGLKQSDCSAIKVDENGTLVVNGGTIGKSVSDSVNSRSIQTFGTTTINGGTIEGVVQVWTWTETGKTFKPSTLTIEGGTFQDSVIICSYKTVSTKYAFGGTVTINGGIFTNEDAMVAVYIPNWGDDLAANTGSGEYAPKMTINGGMFDAKVGVYDLGVEGTDKWLTEASYLTINGGSFLTEPKANDIAKGYEAMKGNDGRYTIVEKTAEEPVDVNAAAEAPTKTETAEDGTVTAAATVDENVINAAIEAAAKEAGVEVGAVETVPAITITATTPEGSETKAEVTEVKLTKEVIDMLVGEGGYETETVTIKTDTGDVTLPSEVLKKAPADGLTLVVGASSAQGEGNEDKVTSPFEVTIYDGTGKEVVDIKNLDTPIKMTIYVGTELPEGSVLAYWDVAKAQYVTIPGATYDKTNGTFTFEVNHLTHFAVITPDQLPAVYKIASCEEVTGAVTGNKRLAVTLSGNFDGTQYVELLITYSKGESAYTATIIREVNGSDPTILFECSANATMVTVTLSNGVFNGTNAIGKSEDFNLTNDSTVTG